MPHGECDRRDTARALREVGERLDEPLPGGPSLLK